MFERRCGDDDDDDDDDAAAVALRCVVMIRGGTHDATAVGVCSFSRRGHRRRMAGSATRCFVFQTAAQATLADVLAHARTHLLTQRPELFIKDGSVCVFA